MPRHICMNRCLHVANLALIREVTLELDPGLNLLTGETGTGKSILVDALAFALGGRAGADLIRSGAERASVQVEGLSGLVSGQPQRFGIAFRCWELL